MFFRNPQTALRGASLGSFLRHRLVGAVTIIGLLLLLLLTQTWVSANPNILKLTYLKSLEILAQPIDLKVRGYDSRVFIITPTGAELIQKGKGHSVMGGCGPLLLSC